jgi:hypothetical protein
LLVLETGLSADTSNLGIIGTASDKPVEGFLLDTSVGINHKQVFVKLRINSNDVVKLMEYLQLERTHGGTVVHVVEEIEQ